jgi:uncharacterized protein (DUF169 family)
VEQDNISSSLNWSKLAAEIESLLHLKYGPVAYKKLNKVKEIDTIPVVTKLDRKTTFCQVPSMVRSAGMTIGVTRNNFGARCARINGLLETTEEQIAKEANGFATTWFASAEEAKKQLSSYPLIPPGKALVLAPMAHGKFEPDVVLIYGNPAQMMLLMNGLQFQDYEPFQFFFTGEGSCADGLARCYNTGKPSLAIPCMGERAFGAVADDEMVMALPPAYLPKAITGLKILRERRIGYPILHLGPISDPTGFLTQIYPEWFED